MRGGCDNDDCNPLAVPTLVLGHSVGKPEDAALAGAA